jgi:hypothetical protein
MSERRRNQEASGGLDAASDSGSAFGETENYTEDEMKQLRNLNAIIQVCIINMIISIK